MNVFLKTQGRHFAFRTLCLFVATSLPSPAGASSDNARIQAALSESVENGAVPERDRLAAESVVNKIVADIQALARANPRASSKQFDEVIRRISAIVPINGALYARGGVPSPLALKLFSAKEFSIRFQDYLSAEEHGNFAKSAMSIAALNQGSEQLYQILPRSEMIALDDAAEAKEASYRRETIDRLTADLTALADNAKAAADFDPLLAQIEAAQEAGSIYDNQLAEQLQRLRQFTSDWQDYYLQLVSNPERATSNLQRMYQESGAYPASLRAKVTERMPVKPPDPNAARPTPTPVTLPDPAGLTEENLHDYVVKLNMNRLGMMNTPEIMGVENVLGQLDAARGGLLSGDPQKAYELYSYHPYWLGDYEAPAQRVREAITIHALLVQFPDAGVAPEPSERAPAHARRIVAAYISAAKWQKVIEALQAADAIGRKSEYAADIAAFRTFVSGIHEELAEQYALAVSSYLQCLASTGQFTPVDELAARMKAIKADHHKEYADGYTAYMEGRPDLADQYQRNGASRPLQVRVPGKAVDGTPLSAGTPQPTAVPSHP
ncbi:MAG TPA: hypothetical protein VII43_03395 [Opitutaceae bacterium]